VWNDAGRARAPYRGGVTPPRFFSGIEPLAFVAVVFGLLALLLALV